MQYTFTAVIAKLKCIAVAMRQSWLFIFEIGKDWCRRSYISGIENRSE
jgi:hypothetical protein